MDGALLLRPLIFFSFFYGRLVEFSLSPWGEESGTEAGSGVGGWLEVMEEQISV